MKVLFQIAILVAILLAGSQAADEEVLTLTDSNFDDAVKSYPFLVVEFYAPWCGHCKRLEPEYEKAAKALKGDLSAGRPITLAKVDATVEKSLGDRFKVQGFPTMYVFENGSTEPIEYEGPREADGIVSYLKKRAGPASKELTSAEDAKALTEAERVVVVLAAEASKEWTATANSMRDAVAWCHTTDKSVMSALGVKAKTIAIIRKWEEKPEVYSGSATDGDAIMAWVKAERVQTAMPIKKGDQESLKIVFEDDSKPNLFLFTSGGDGVAEFTKGAKPTKGKMVSGVFEKDDFPEAFSHFGMDKFDKPMVLLEDRKNEARYTMDGEIKADLIAEFLKGYEAGTLKPYLKSEAPPADNSGPVKVIVGDTFDKEVLNAGKPVFLEAYAPWCGHCKRLAPVWDDLGKAFADAKIDIAKVDATANDIPKSLGVKGFPTLLLFKGDGSEPSKYEGERDFETLSAWITSQTGAKMVEGFKPTAPAKPKEGIDKKILRFLGQEYQVPFMSSDYTVPGLYIAAVVIFLIFVASISLVIACLSKDSPAPPKNKKE